MKKFLTLITLVISISNLSALELLPPYDFEVEKRILALCNIPPPYTNLTKDIKELATEYKIPSEQMAKALEIIIREGLADVKTKYDDYWEPTTRAIGMLRVFHDQNTLALLDECTLFKSERVRQEAVLTYLEIEKTNAIPFLRKIINEGRIFRRQFLYTHLRLFIAYFRLQDKTGAELFYPFILDLLQVEQNALNSQIPDASNLIIIHDPTGRWNATVFYNAYFLPDLTSYIDGYSNSIQRKRFIQHFYNYPIETAPAFIRDAFYNAKDEIDRIPENNLIDLSKQFILEPINQDMPQNEPSLKTRMTAYLLNRHYSGENVPTFARSFAKRYNVPAERMAKILEDIVREKLSELKEINQKSMQEITLVEREKITSIWLLISKAYQILEIYHSHETLTLLEECIQMNVNDIQAKEIFLSIIGEYDNTN